MRIIKPSALNTATQRFLYLLPVEANNDALFGDPIAEALALDIANTYNMIVVNPAFSILPWYGDNPAQATVRQEGYLLNDIIPGVEALYPGHNTRLLCGFSKSGVGALSLILRNQASFAAAAIWDAPVNDAIYNVRPGMAEVFNTQANYDGYAIPTILPTYAASFTVLNRIYLAGYKNYQADLLVCHNSMTALGMLHTWVDVLRTSHLWSSGWLPGAVTFLNGFS